MMFPGIAPSSVPPISTATFARRLNGKTDCKRFFRLASTSEEDKDQTLRKLMLWLACAKEYPRQRDHMTMDVDNVPLPPYSFLQGRKETVGPEARHVRHDIDLDDAGVELHILPPDSWARCAELEAAARASAEASRRAELEAAAPASAEASRRPSRAGPSRGRAKAATISPARSHSTRVESSSSSDSSDSSSSSSSSGS